MRYKVKAPSRESFLKAEQIARADTHVFVSLEGRLVLSVGDLSEAARGKLAKLGAIILPDTQFNLVGQ
ncbi:MAG: hypothetical protein ACR2PC_12900 [Tsuneonella suprasediminis]